MSQWESFAGRALFPTKCQKSNETRLSQLMNSISASPKPPECVVPLLDELCFIPWVMEACGDVYELVSNCRVSKKERYRRNNRSIEEGDVACGWVGVRQEEILCRSHVVLGDERRRGDCFVSKCELSFFQEFQHTTAYNTIIPAASNTSDVLSIQDMP